ncbi:hypothetical protein LSUE1_G002379 [Lachnellula suecica]|uniref:Uncharacterized protein n=1 Tax=Lachnellula suecica TaxID=602035 RepID=A0A8T9CCR6_9HELO|nr:hypothetical protein LSUE1_G002379 [Lachnellula suecica]
MPKRMHLSVIVLGIARCWEFLVFVQQSVSVSEMKYLFSPPRFPLTPPNCHLRFPPGSNRFLPILEGLP